MNKKIPMPHHIIQTDDGALCFQWYGENCRVMLHLEVNPSESGWHFVNKLSVGGEMFCEELSKTNINQLIKCIFKTHKQSGLVEPTQKNKWWWQFWKIR